MGLDGHRISVITDNNSTLKAFGEILHTLMLVIVLKVWPFMYNLINNHWKYFIPSPFYPTRSVHMAALRQ